MLQSFRHLAKSAFFKALLVLLVGSFAVWGIGDIFRGRPHQEAAIEVGPLSISFEELDNRFRLELMRLTYETKRQITPPEAVGFGLRDRTVNLMAQQALFNLEARRVGLLVPVEPALAEIHASPQFMDEKGQFDPRRFQLLLNEMRMSEPQYLELLRNESAREQLVLNLAAGARAPESLLRELYRGQAETRTVEVWAIKAADQPVDAAPSDGVLLRYYQDHNKDYQTPETRDFTLIHLSVDAMASGIAVTDADLAAAYESRKDGLATAEQRDLEQVLVDDDKTAAAIENAVKGGLSLAAAAEKHGATVTTLTKVVATELPPELQKAVFGLAKGEVSPPLQSALGYHLIKVTGITPRTVPSFAEAKSRVLTELRRERAEEQFQEELNRLDDALASGQKIEEVAAKVDLKTVSLKAIPSTTLTIVGFKDEAAKKIIVEAFKLDQGDNSGLIELPNGDYAALRVDGVKPKGPKPFDTVKAEVTAAYLHQQKMQKAKEVAEKAKEAFAKGKNGFTGSAGASKPLTLTRFGLSPEGLNSAALADVFTLKIGQAAINEDNDGYRVLKLISVTAGDPDAKDSTLPALRQSLDEAMRNGMAAELSQTLEREHFPIRQHSAVIARVGAASTEE